MVKVKKAFTLKLKIFPKAHEIGLQKFEFLKNVKIPYILHIYTDITA